MKYDELESTVVSAEDTETMDLETARQLLHQMVREVYAKPWWFGLNMANTDTWYYAYVIENDTITIVDACHAQNMHD